MAANLLQIDAERRRPHCQSGGAVRRGTTRGLRRYSCKRCGQTFTAPAARRCPALGRSLVEREAVRQSARRRGGAVSTAFRCRHRFPHEAANVSAAIRMRGSDHIQALNNRHQRWKACLGPFRGWRRSAWTWIGPNLRWHRNAHPLPIEPSGITGVAHTWRPHPLSQIGIPGRLRSLSERRKKACTDRREGLC